jgi:peptide deformylase
MILHPNPILRQKAASISDALAPEIQSLIPQMIEAMKGHRGIGLAAPQIGQSIRLIIVNHQDGPIAMINPIITKKSLLKKWDEEGCLSIPGVYGEVKRHQKVSVTYTDKTGASQTLDAEGLLARIVQHEIDHIDGILFIDKARNLVQEVAQ